MSGEFSVRVLEHGRAWVSSAWRNVTKQTTLALGLTAAGFSAFVQTLLGAADAAAFRALTLALQPPQGRLTLTSGTPVLTSDVTAATSIYYTPHVGNRVPIYDGSKFCDTVASELTLALSSNSGHTGYHQSGKNFDLFVFNDSGTIRLGSGPAWTNDTTRADAVTRLQGVYVNNATITLRFGSASGNTVSVAANRATLVGTFRASADGQTQMKFGSAAAGGGEAWFGVCNLHNAEPTPFSVRDSTSSWAYGSGTTRSANNSATNRVSLVRCTNERPVEARAFVGADHSNGESADTGIGLDSTSAATVGSPRGYQDSGNTIMLTLVSQYAGYPGLGFHYLQATEAVAIGTVDFLNLSIRGIAWL